MFYGIIGTAPNAAFVVNNKADASGSNLLTVRKSDGIIRGNGAVPPGMIMDFGGGAAPVGWLLCDGATVPITSYQELFNAIGGTWGWNGSTTFNLPNLQNRYRRHRGNLAGGPGTLQNPANLGHVHQIYLNNGRTGANDRDLSHQHTGTTDGMNGNNPHNHPWHATDNQSRGSNLLGSNSSGPGGYGGGGVFGYPVTFSIDNTDINHGHTFTTDPNQGGVDHLHRLDLNFNSQGGSADDSNESRPYSATVLTCIKT